MPQYFCRDKRTTFGSQRSPSTTWVLVLSSGCQAWRPASSPTGHLAWVSPCDDIIRWEELAGTVLSIQSGLALCQLLFALSSLGDTKAETLILIKL